MAMRVIEGRHGRFLCQDNDRYVGRSLAAYGEYSEAEVALLARFLAPGGVVVEAGANVGAHTVPLARLVGREGKVFAFEPQRLVFQMLCGNLALNEIENAYAFAMGLADRPGQARVPVIGYGAEANYGGVELGNEEGEAVSIGTVDLLRLDRLDLLKADVEGTEELVLRGAEATIRQARPVLYLENDRREKSPALLAYLQSLGYRAWWHVPRLFSPDNYLRNEQDLFGTIASVNILCRHAVDAHPVPDLQPVAAPDEWPL